MDEEVEDELPEASDLVAMEVRGMVALTMSFIDAIGLYKIALGFGDDDEDVERVRAALTVQLSAIVGP